MPRQTDPLLTLPDKSGVLYVRLYQRMRALIMQGAWPAGMRLPSSRMLAADLGVSRNTASLAFDQLLADGWIETRSRAGTFVSPDLPIPVHARPVAGATSTSAARPPIPFEMAHGAVDAFPFDRWARLQSKVWSNFVPDLLYDGDPAGDPGLREAIATIVAPMRGLTIIADELMIVGSTISALDLIAAAMPANSTVIVEDPGYHFADGAFLQRGFKIVAAAVDEDGLIIDQAQKACPSPSLIMVGSASQFPRGVPLSNRRRGQLLDWARECGAWVIDDMFDADARFDGAAPCPALQSGDGSDRVISICSLSRALFRSLRLGFMTIPKQLRKDIFEARMNLDASEPLANQLVLREFIDRGYYSSHQRRLRELYSARRSALVGLLQPYFGTVFDEDLNPCGLHLVLRPLKYPADEIADRLRSAGIACTTLAELTRGVPGEEGLLLGFAAYSPDVIEASRPALEATLSGFS